MGKLIIDGNSFFEIDEECIKKKRISEKCGLNKYLKDYKSNDTTLYIKNNKISKKKSDG